MKYLFSSTFLILLLASAGITYGQQEIKQHITSHRRNSKAQQKKPYVILISADGFRYDYMEKYQPEHLLNFSTLGVKATSMIPSFPSLTFPNHYSIITGLYPSHHGIVNNNFYDPERKAIYSSGNKQMIREGSWYGGTPLWVLAEQQKLLSATMFWVGSEAAVKDTHPSYYYNYNEQLIISKRIEAVKNWLMLPEKKRPHFITFYLYEPDHTGHLAGADAPGTAQAVRMVDTAIYQLIEAVNATGLPVNFIFVSDHGMTAINTEHPLPLPESIDTSRFIIPSSGTMVELYARNKEDIQPLYERLKKEENHYNVYLKTNVPAELHYSAADDTFNRIGDILLIPEWPYFFSAKKPSPGQHGFPPLKVKDMQATFLAWGPAFKKNISIPSFENVNVYPLIAEILGLRITEPIDGRREVLSGILK